MSSWQAERLAEQALRDVGRLDEAYRLVRGIAGAVWAEQAIKVALETARRRYASAACAADWTLCGLQGPG